MKEKILIIFDLYGNITREDINNFELLKNDFTDILLMDDLSQNQNILNEYKVIYDCTNNNNIFNFIKTKGALELIDKFKYLKINDQCFIEGIAIQHFMITKRELEFIPQELKEIKKNTTLEFMKKLEFLKQFIEIKTKYEDVEKGLEQGIEYHTESGKKFIITKKIPDIKDENSQYITNTDIPIIKDILHIFEYIKE